MLPAHLNLAKFLSNSCFSRWKSWMYFIWGHKATAEVGRDVSTRNGQEDTSLRTCLGIPPAQDSAARYILSLCIPAVLGKGFCALDFSWTPQSESWALPRLWHFQVSRSLLTASPRACPCVPGLARVAQRGVGLNPSINQGATQGQSHHPAPSGRDGPTDRPDQPPPHGSWEPGQEKPRKSYRSDRTKQTPGFSC